MTEVTPFVWRMGNAAPHEPMLRAPVCSRSASGREANGTAFDGGAGFKGSARPMRLRLPRVHTRAVTETANAEPTHPPPMGPAARSERRCGPTALAATRIPFKPAPPSKLRAVCFATGAEREHRGCAKHWPLVEQGAALPIRQTNDVTSVIQSLRASAVVSGAALFDCRLCLEQALLLT